MVNIQKIKAKMVELNMTQKEVAEAMGIDSSTFNVKLNETSKRQFTIKEAQDLVKILKIDDPKEYFF